jgi:hypothetical protein
VNTENKLREALAMAVRQNEHDMLMTGEELRTCRAALISADAEPVALNKHVIFDKLTRRAQQRTSPENVEDVLAAISARYGRLYTTHSSPEAAEAGEAVAGEKLWLWKNGDHYLAYRHLYPCFTPGGDPMTLGEPVGYALIRESHDRATPSKPHFMSMEAAQNRATQREHGRIDGMVGALKKIQEERKAEAEARPVGEEYALLRELVDAEDAQDAMRMAHPATRQMISAEEAHAVGDRVDKAWIAARQALSAAPREAVPRGYVRADEAMSVHQLFDDLCDVVAEANAADTVMGRPEVLRSKLIKIRDAVGDAVNGYIPFAAPAAPREVAGWKWMPPEATPEMIAAVEDRSDRLWSTGAVYRAMFSAAPQEGTP